MLSIAHICIWISKIVHFVLEQMLHRSSTLHSPNSVFKVLVFLAVKIFIIFECKKTASPLMCSNMSTHSLARSPQVFNCLRKVRKFRVDACSVSLVYTDIICYRFICLANERVNKEANLCRRSIKGAVEKKLTTHKYTCTVCTSMIPIVQVFNNLPFIVSLEMPSVAIKRDTAHFRFEQNAAACFISFVCRHTFSLNNNIEVSSRKQNKANK